MALIANTLPELLHRHAERYGSRAAVRCKRDGMWMDVSWEEWRERVCAAALGLVEQGVAAGDRVAILSENRLEWVIADLAILSAGAVTVPLHAALAAEQIQQMLADSEATAIVVSTVQQAAKVTAIAGRTKLHTIIAMDGSTDLTWDGLEQRGRLASSRIRDQQAAREKSLGPDRLASLIYTSGTTGAPKGVMLTHGNFLANTAAMIDALGGFAPGAVCFNWLPLSHVYGRTVDYYIALAVGGVLALGPSPETVVDDVRAIRPMHFSSVPRFYEKVLSSVAGLPVEQRRERLRAIFGPRLRWLGCGGAALAPGVAEAYREAGFEVVVGYGMTESSPVITTNSLRANKLGAVGRVLPDVELRIASDGEILTRGPHVMAGYWRQPEATAAAIKDGWLHTGDLGVIDGDGFLTITGRKKDLIVLSSGKNVAPFPIEGRLLASPLIEQVVIFGEGRPFLSAIVAPRDASISRQALADELEALQSNLPPWEKVRKFIVTTRAFSVGSEEMTVSMKLRRTAIFEHYREELEELYR